MKISKQSKQPYQWGDGCSGWILVDDPNLSIIEEFMPPGASEQLHYHHRAQQLFYVLRGVATMEVGDKVIVLKEEEAIHIQTRVSHRISNRHDQNLEFILISQPSTRGDRIIAHSDDLEDIDLNGKRFKSINSSENGDVDNETIFEYRQNGQIVWATYTGGAIRFGTLSGQIIGEELSFCYQHQNLTGEFKTGRCQSIVKRLNAKIYLREKWQWTCDDYSYGESTLEEII